MKKDIDFLIFWETKVREIESIILLGEYLKSKGYKVEYFAFNDLYTYFKSKKFFNRVKVAVMPSLYHNAEINNIVYKIAGKCDKIVNLRWEQVYQNKDQKNYECYCYPKQEAKKCYHCCWGTEEFKELSESGIDEKYLRVTGPLQMDFVSGKLQEYYLNKEDLLNEFGIPGNFKICLFTSSFSTANMTDAQIEIDGSQPGANKQALLDSRNFNRKCRNLLLEWIKSFLVKYSDICLIYRPHPVENADDLKYMEKQYPNFRVISKYNVKQWIIRADYVFTWVSTSIAEAYFAKKNCFIVRPFPIEQNKDMTIYSGTSFITNKEEFLNIPNKKDEITLNKQLLESYYDVSTTYSFVRTAEFLIDVMKREDNFVWNNIDLLEIKDNIIKAAIRWIYHKLIPYIPSISKKIITAKTNYTRNKNNKLYHAEYKDLRKRLLKYI